MKNVEVSYRLRNAKGNGDYDIKQAIKYSNNRVVILNGSFKGKRLLNATICITYSNYFFKNYYLKR